MFEDHVGMYRNTDLCVDLKTFLHHDCIAMIGRSYAGKLMRDEEMHFTFVENAVSYKNGLCVKRNPIVIAGHCVNLHRKADGTYYLTFRNPVLTPHYTWKNFCIEAAKEILSLISLVDDGRKKART